MTEEEKSKRLQGKSQKGVKCQFTGAENAKVKCMDREWWRNFISSMNGGMIFGAKLQLAARATQGSLDGARAMAACVKPLLVLVGSQE